MTKEDMYLMQEIKSMYERGVSFFAAFIDDEEKGNRVNKLCQQGYLFEEVFRLDRPPGINFNPGPSPYPFTEKGDAVFCSSESNKNIEKIQWKGTEPELIALFELLQEADLLSGFVKKMVIVTGK